MRKNQSKNIRLLALAFSVALTCASLTFAQDPARDPAQDRASRPQLRQVASGAKLKLKGTIVDRAADTFIVRDEQGLETQAVLTERTSVKSKGGFFRRGTNYDVTSLLRGLAVEVEGRGNPEGQLVAEKVRFNSSDLRVARSIDTRVGPIEADTRRLSGQVDELNEVSKVIKGEAERANLGVAAANERISALDDYTVQDSATVYFNVNSWTLSPEGRQSLDEIARKAASAKGYVIEIAGFTDTTGSLERNRILSQRRADSVVRYLQENHDIPLRRMVTPFGYGPTRPAADNATPDGRRQNRRVEVKVLISRGLTQQPTQ